MITYSDARQYSALAGYERPASRDRRRSISAWFGRFGAWAERQRRYHATIAELGLLSERELNEIGIGRWQIRTLARQAADSAPAVR